MDEGGCSERLEEAQLDIIEMAYMALGQMEALKKKEVLVLVAHAMLQEEFNQLVLAQSEGGTVMTNEGIITSIDNGDGNDGLLACENPDVLNVGVGSLDVREDGGAI